MTANSEMPNLVVIGAGKCGTSSLHSYLDQHPEISMSRVKEPGYFLGSGAPAPLFPIRERDRYLELFDAGCRIRGESTVAYSMYPIVEGVPAAMAREVPDAQLVYLVRDPIERILSSVKQVIAGRASASVARADFVSAGDWVGDLRAPGNTFVAGSRYMTQILRFLEYFPAESILVVDSDDLRLSREETMSEVFRFLDCDPSLVEGGFESEKNMSVNLTIKPAPYRWLKKRSGLRGWYRRQPEGVRDSVGGRLGRFFGRPVPTVELDPGLRLSLEEILTPEVEGLREFTGQEFAGWSV